MRHVEHHAQRVQMRYHIPAEVGQRRAGEAVHPRTPAVVVLHGRVGGAHTMSEQAIHRMQVYGVCVSCEMHDHAHAVIGGRRLQVATPLYEAGRRAAAHGVHHVRDAA